MSGDLRDLEKRVDDATMAFVAPLRLDKSVNDAQAASLLKLADDLSVELAGLDLVPRRLVAKAMFIFTAMLAEADHTSGPERERILDVAWEWQERLRRGLEAGLYE